MGEDALESVSSGGRRKPTNSSSQALPQWMIDYFDWHNQTKRSLKEDNLNDTKYLIKPLPFVVLQAARSKRLLLIYWSRPKWLEEFLIPPEGRMDWCAPQWQKRHLKKLVLMFHF
jgi:hypothetical protein